MNDFESSQQNIEERLPARRRGVTFELNSDGGINHGTCDDGIEESFHPAGTDFIDDLDFLENCGVKSASTEEMERKSLYVKFDPLCHLSSPGILKSTPKESSTSFMESEEEKAARDTMKDIESNNFSNEEVLQTDTRSIKTDPSDILYTKCADFSNYDLTDILKPITDENVYENSNFNINDQNSAGVKDTTSTTGNMQSMDPLSQRDNGIDEVASNGLHLIEPFPISRTTLEGTVISEDAVQPFLYTQSDIEDSTKKVRSDCENEMRVVDADWQKKYDDLEKRRKEEISIRATIEKENTQSASLLKKECFDMKQVLSQYERTIHEISESAHKYKMTYEESITDSIHSKESLQKDLNTAEQNLYDAYKRIEKLKRTIDSYKENEERLLQSSGDLIRKIETSENKYDLLKADALKQIDVANDQYSKLRKQQDMDSAGVHAALKVAQSKSNNLDLEIKQKNVENAQLHQICDDLIKKVSGS